MRQAPDHRVTSHALAPAASTPPILTNNTACQHCVVWLNALARHFQAQVIQARERAQVGTIKDSIGHVEVFQMDGVGTPIIERPRPLPGHDTPNPANNTYTLNYEEPANPPSNTNYTKRPGQQPHKQTVNNLRTTPTTLHRRGTNAADLADSSPASDATAVPRKPSAHTKPSVHPPTGHAGHSYPHDETPNFNVGSPARASRKIAIKPTGFVL